VDANCADNVLKRESKKFIEANKGRAREFAEKIAAWKVASLK
jgi:hypothetical protein